MFSKMAWERGRGARSVPFASSTNQYTGNNTASDAANCTRGHAAFMLLAGVVLPQATHGAPAQPQSSLLETEMLETEMQACSVCFSGPGLRARLLGNGNRSPRSPQFQPGTNYRDPCRFSGIFIGLPVHRLDPPITCSPRSPASLSRRPFLPSGERQ
jgi:hypothetical protein